METWKSCSDDDRADVELWEKKREFTAKNQLLKLPVETDKKEGRG